MNKQVLNNVGLLILAIVFSTGLIFAFIEVPRLLDASLQKHVGFPGFDHGGGEVNALKTEMFIQGLHLRWIGYGSLLFLLALIIFGYSSRKSGWAMAGAVGLFIPVFGQFALSMFFLAGLGLLRVGWLPFLELSSFDLLDLGKVIYVPYWILMYILGLFKWNAHTFLSYLFMASGAFLFTWGVLIWFQSRYSGQKVASSWIYKLSRHPQYLGWILWSYGFILFTPFENTMKMSWSVSSSLPWLLMTMTILGICLLEEMKMMEITNGAYSSYRKSSPFLLPLPRRLNTILSWPARKISRNDYPTRRIQVLWIVLLYTGIFMAISLFWMDFNHSGKKPVDTNESRAELSEIMIELKQMGDNRREIYPLVDKIPAFGQTGIDSLLVLAAHPNPIIREFSIQQLGEHKVLAAEDIFIENMYDSIRRVRSSAMSAAGHIQSEKAADSLIHMLTNPRVHNYPFSIYGALGAIGDPKAIPYLADGLDGQEWFNQNAALDAIMDLNPQIGIKYAIKELQDADVHVRRNAVTVCILSGDPQIIEPLEELFEDEDFEVRFYAKQGVKRILKETDKN